MRYEIHFKGWTPTGWGYDSTYAQEETNKNDYKWEIIDLIHWYFEDITEEGFEQIRKKKEDGCDCFITYIVYNDKDEVIYEIGFWESEEAKNYEEA